MFVVGRFSIVKMSVLPKFNYNFNAIPIKIPVNYGCQQTDFNIYMERQKTHNSQDNIEGEQVGGLTLPSFKTYYNQKSRNQGII